jgi:Spherulation-specific family 4
MMSPMRLFAAAGLGLVTCFVACGGGGENGAAGGAGAATSGSTAGAPAGGAGGASASDGGAGATGGHGGSGGQAGGGGGGGSAAGTIVPLYTDPSDASWSALATAATMHPTVQVIAIANPDSGPGAQKQAGYTNGIAKLKAAHVLVIGYVATGYAMKPAAQVRADIDTWASFYPGVGGIFFDEMSSTAGDEAFYSALKAYAGAHGFPVTVGNPGTDTLASFVGTVDTLLIYESDGVPPVASLGGWHDQFPRSNFGVIPYAVPSLDTAFVMAARQHVGFVYLTDDDLPNPWDSLASYFDPLLAALE